MTCKHIDCNKEAIYKSKQLCRQHYQQIYKRADRQIHNYTEPDVDYDDYWEYVKKELKL
jgi:hypothetical protein